MVEITLAKELVANRNRVEELKTEIKSSKEMIKVLVDREDDIINELGVRFDETPRQDY